MDVTPRESMISLCKYFYQLHHKNQNPPDLSVLSVAQCGKDAPVENGRYSNCRIYDISDPDFLKKPSPDFESYECKCNDCYINSWTIYDMDLLEKERQSNEKQVWIFFGNFWKYDSVAPKIPADVTVIGKDIASAKEFNLKFADKWETYLSHQEEECYSSWDHQQIENLVRTESTRLDVDPSDLQVYIGRMFEKWD